MMVNYTKTRLRLALASDRQHPELERHRRHALLKREEARTDEIALDYV